MRTDKWLSKLLRMFTQRYGTHVIQEDVSRTVSYSSLNFRDSFFHDVYASPPRPSGALLLERFVTIECVCTGRVYGAVYDEEFIDTVSIMSLCDTLFACTACATSTLGFRVPSSWFKLVIREQLSHACPLRKHTTAPVSFYAKLLICRLNRHFCIAFRSPKRRGGGRSLIGRVHARLFDSAVTRAHLDMSDNYS